jgi:hypothetical protein
MMRRLALLLIFVPFVPLVVIACKKPDQATPEATGGRRGRGGGGEGGVAFAVDLLQV